MRCGFTLVEALVGASVFLLAISMIYTFFLGATNSTGKSVEASDALRSVLIATEALRHDAGRLVFQRRTDLVLTNQNRGLSTLVPEAFGTDLWNNQTSPVTYSLEPVEGASEVFRLIRKDSAGSHALGGCLLKDLLITYVAPKDISKLQAYLQVTMIGLGSTSAKATYTGSALLPLNQIVQPQPYVLPEAAP